MDERSLSVRWKPRRALEVYVSDRNRIRPASVDPEVDSKGGERNPVPELTSEGSSIPVPGTLEFGRSAGTWRDRKSG